jgi:peptidoglycan/xylan/chitin deacetylase (PgdA/CDA1 family)
MSFRRPTSAALAVSAAALLSACAGREAASSSESTSTDTSGAAPSGAPAAASAGEVAQSVAMSSASSAGADARAANELGRIPVLEYHLIVPQETNEFTRTPQRLRQDLEELYKRGYRPVNMTDVLDKKIQSLPKGLSPVVLVFDDASPSQFRYLERGGKLVIDPTSAVGILEEFSNKHADWPRKAVFCMLPAAQVGRSFFGDKGIEGQKTEWRFQKLQFLHKQGYELCNHTLYHARLDKSGDRVQEFIARGDMAIDSAVPGYKVRTFALPLGMWPKNRPLAWAGSWTDPKSNRTVRYNYDAVLEVSGNPNESPYDPKFDRHSVNRQIMFKNALEATLNRLDGEGPAARYVSDGDPSTVARPSAITPVQAKARGEN